MKSQKFKPPVFTRRAGYKNTDHSAASGWLAKVIAAVKDGTPAALKRHAIAYHGVPPHMQDDLNAPTEPRPSVAPTEPQDVPDADDMVRTIDATQFPTAAGGSMRRQQNPDLVFGKKT
jgi:hypothetical protein